MEEEESMEGYDEGFPEMFKGGGVLRENEGRRRELTRQIDRGARSEEEVGEDEPLADTGSKLVERRFAE